MCKFIKKHYILSIVGFVVITVISAIVIGNTAVRIHSKMNPEPCPFTEAGILDHPLREWFQSSKAVLERSGVEPGLKILEIGCGSGYYTTRILERMEGKGKLYSLDIQQEMLDLVKNKLENSPYETEIELVLGDAYNLPFDDDFFDLIMYVTVLPEVPDQMLALTEARRVLKKGGIVAQSEMIVDPDYPWKSTVISQLESAGFSDIEANGSFMAYTVTGKK